MGRVRGTHGGGQKYRHAKIRLGVTRCRWEDNINIGLKNKMGWTNECGSERGKLGVCYEERK
jgi:hypothetical protein